MENTYWKWIRTTSVGHRKNKGLNAHQSYWGRQNDLTHYYLKIRKPALIRPDARNLLISSVDHCISPMSR